MIGICDYIPPQLKSVANLNIWLEGETDKIVNSVLWNEYYTKTLLKECYYQVLQSYVFSENGSANLVGGVFLRMDDKIYKLNDIMEWSSDVRGRALKCFKERGEMHIESFNSQANMRKVNIYIGLYPPNIPNLHFGLKIIGSQSLHGNAQPRFNS